MRHGFRSYPILSHQLADHHAEQLPTFGSHMALHHCRNWIRVSYWGVSEPRKRRVAKIRLRRVASFSCGCLEVLADISPQAPGLYIVCRYASSRPPSDLFPLLIVPAQRVEPDSNIHQLRNPPFKIRVVVMEAHISASA
jgi:hypothetical protein